MIKILGAKRVLILLVLIAVNAALAATVYMYLEPEVTKEERTLNSVRAQENQTRADISSLQLEFDQLEAQQDEFDVLKRDGFFSNQDRRVAQEVLLGAEKESGVLSATVSVKSGSINQDEEAAKADHVILESPILITLTSIDDTDVYVYLDYLQKNFPGHVTVKNLYMRRLANVSDTILRAIASGAKPAMVEAKLELVWRTMVESEDVMDITNETGGL